MSLSSHERTPLDKLRANGALQSYGVIRAGGIMMASLPEVYLARHGETAWTITGQHTGRTDIPLTARGEQNALNLRQRLNGVTFAKVLVSPLSRARRTCELAGFGDT